MPFNTTADNQALNSLIAGFTISGNTYSNLLAYATLHTAYSTSGANEIAYAGSSPGNARQAVTWASGGPSGGSFATASVANPFNIPANTTVAFVGLTSAATAALTSSNFAGMGANGGATIYSFSSTAHTGSPVDTITVPTLPTSTYANNTPVVVWTGVGAPSLPSNLTAGTIYYVVNYSAPSGVTPATFQLSTTSGGSVMNIGTSPGSGLIQAITLETFSASGGTFTLTSDTLTLS